MSSEEKSYIAFISYRHAEVDTAAARDVQRGLERFRVPRALQEEGAPDRLAPVFRDKEELPVSAAIGDDIAHALAHTESLVVVCSPRTRESSWVRREIDMFLQTHDRSRVFTVLAEGEPADIIPEQLLSETVDGVERPLEPLSCDFRTTRREDRRTELVRLAAAILGVSFDSLMQRDRRRRTRIAAAVFCTILAVVAGIAGFALWSNARIQEHYDEAVANHSRLLATEAQQQLEGGARLAAIELATAAMPQKGEGRSASPDATHVLQQATGAYERLAGSHHPSSLCMVARRALGQGVRRLRSSPNGAYVGAMGDHGLVRVWNADSMEQLLETQVLDPVYSGFVITDNGRVVVGCQKRVSCWDLQSKECCWDVDMWERTNGSYGSTTYHLVLSDDQKHVYVLGRGLACSIDVTSGESAAEVSYGPGSDDGLNFVGGDANVGDIVADCADNVCVVSMTYIDKQTSKYYDTLCSLDFAAGTCTILPTRYGAIRDIRLLDRTSVVMSYGDDRPHVDGYRNPNGVVGQEQRLRHVARRDLRSDEVAWQRDITFWSPAWYESLCPISNLKARFLEEGDARQVLAYSVANVCEVIDPDTGAPLDHYEAPLPFVAMWPHVSEGRVTGMYGCLSKGMTFANYFSSGLCSSLDGQCVDAELGIRVGERAILANAEGALYVYESPRKDDAITMLEQMAVAKAIPTKHGILVVGVPEESESGQKSVRLRMVDCAGKRVKWERTIAGNETESAKPMSYDEGCSELYMRLFVKDDEVDMATVDLATGEVQDWKATSNASKAGEGMPYVPIVGSYSGRIVTDMAYGVDRKGVVVTDLHERTTRTIWPEGLDNEMSPPWLCAHLPRSKPRVCAAHGPRLRKDRPGPLCPREQCGQDCGAFGKAAQRRRLAGMVG